MNMALMNKTLGGERVLHREIHDEADLYRLTQTGIPKKSLMFFAEYIGISLSYFVEQYLDISYRTLQRKKDFDVLPSFTSEQILRFVKLYVRGLEVFDDDSEAFQLWLSTPCKPLGGSKPQELMDNGFGIQMISEQLDRMDYGIYS